MPPTSDALLRYRAWRGDLRPPAFGAVAVARAGLRLMARRRLTWGLYALALMVFFFFFYGQYLVVWIQQQVADQQVSFGAFRVDAGVLARFLDRFHLSGDPHTFGNYIWFQGYVAAIALALAGAVLVGNDFHHGSLAFYLSKPIGRWHYVAGKCLAVGAFVHLLTTAPAVVLYAQAGLLHDGKAYFASHLRELAGILGYGLALAVTLSLLLVATAVWVRRTAPLILVWAGLFVLARAVAAVLVDGMGFDPRWRLVDLWNDLYLVGLWALGVPPERVRPPDQPPFWQAAAVCGAVCGASVLYLRRRIQAVEVIG